MRVRPVQPNTDFQFDEDDFAIKLTPAHCRSARGWLGWTQVELSRLSGVGTTAIKDYEKGNRRTHKGIQLLLQNAFAKAGVHCSTAGIYHEDEIDEDAEPPE